MIKNTIIALIAVFLMYYANLIKEGFEVYCMFYVIYISFILQDIYKKICE